MGLILTNSLGLLGPNSMSGMHPHPISKGLLASIREMHDYPNYLLKQTSVYETVIEITDVKKHTSPSMISVRDGLEIGREFARIRPTGSEKVTVRRMMSCYWGNSSPFALDLIGAVLRQGSFVEKMHSIGWIRAVDVVSTIQSFIGKYKRYFKILAAYPKNVAVPTLDVDLAWRKMVTSNREFLG